MNTLSKLNSVNLISPLQERLVEKKLSINKLAENIDMTKDRLVKMINSGKMEIPVLIKISIALDYNFFELYTDKSDLEENVRRLESQNENLSSRVEKLETENRIYKDTMEVLKRIPVPQPVS